MGLGKIRDTLIERIRDWRGFRAGINVSRWFYVIHSGSAKRMHLGRNARPI